HSTGPRERVGCRWLGGFCAPTSDRGALPCRLLGLPGHGSAVPPPDDRASESCCLRPARARRLGDNSCSTSIKCSQSKLRQTGVLGAEIDLLGKLASAFVVYRDVGTGYVWCRIRGHHGQGTRVAGAGVFGSPGLWLTGASEDSSPGHPPREHCTTSGC